MKIKNVKFATTQESKHWVGDGFFVHGLLQPTPELNKWISPFILLDYASPHYFESVSKPRGVGEHPHRGFETVTFAFQGEVEHRDSAGGGGIIRPGDVQWMTAGSGLVHEEFHSKNFTKSGGIFEMIQLWVNLPKKFKMTEPRYQAIISKQIESVKLDSRSNVRVIAGQLRGVIGQAKTRTKINVFDLESSAQTVQIPIDADTNTILLIISGDAGVGEKVFPTKSLIIFERTSQPEMLQFRASENFRAMIFNGEPIDEPIYAHGPFVMNTREEIITAIQDYKDGKMGRLYKPD